MDRRIRVKCLECAASIELRVDQQELLDVTCPRCRHVFTAIVPPQIVEVAPIEIIEVEETPPVRMTRVVQPTAAPRPPKRVRQLPQSAPSPLGNSNWQAPSPQYQYRAAPRVSAATHLKAFLIAGGSVVGLGLLVMVGFMLKSAVSGMDWSSSSEGSSAGSTATVSPATEPASPSSAGSTLVTDATGTTGETASTFPGIAATTAPANGSVETIPEKIIKQAKELATATKDWDHDFVLDRTYPKLIELAGGRAKMRDTLDKAMEPIKAQGATISDFTVSNNLVVRNLGTKIYAVVPTTMDLDFPNRLLRVDSFLLAISEDSGRTFTFLSGSAVAKDKRLFKRVLPDWPDDFVLPAPGTPRDLPK